MRGSDDGLVAPDAAWMAAAARWPSAIGVDEVARSVRDVAAGPDLRVRGRQRRRIDAHGALRGQIDVDAAEQVEVGGLAHGEDDRVGGQGRLGARAERRREAALGVEDRLDLDRLEPGDVRVADEALRAAPVDDA